MTDTWESKKEPIRLAVESVMRGFAPGRDGARCVFWSDETPNAADPRVILNATTLYEEVVVRTADYNPGTHEFANGHSSINDFDLDVRIESVKASGARSADNVGASLRLRFREDDFRAALALANVKTIGAVGPLRYVGKGGDDRKVTQFVFTVPMRTELFEAQLTTTGTVDNTSVTGTLQTNPGQEPPVNVSVEITTVPEE